MKDAMNVRIRLRTENGQIPKVPTYATSGAAGADLYACIAQEVVLKPGESKAIPTGISIELPGPHVVALIFARSGLAAKNQISLTNAVGVIDSDYRGEIRVLLINHGQEEFIIHPGDRIAQIVFMPVFRPTFEIAEALSETERGEGGFGSTGIR